MAAARQLEVLLMILATCLLAGGEGRRMGGKKPLHPLHGRPLIAHAFQVANAADGPVWLSLRHRRDAPALMKALVRDLPIVFDDADIPGPLGAIVAALRVADVSGLEGIVTLPCDAPFLPFDLVQRLTMATENADAAVAHVGSDDHPVCAGWRVSALPAIEREIAHGRLSLRRAATVAQAVKVYWPDHLAFCNLNTAEELAAAEARSMSMAAL